VPGEHAGRGFRLGQLGTSSLVALAHGTNDAQKTMGVVTLTLVAGGRLGGDDAIPFWVKFACAAAIGAGTFSGGWRVIRTLGTRVTAIEPAQGFSAESASSTTILASSYFGFSLSTTQVVSGGIMGSGIGKAAGVVHWNVVRNMVAAWLLTLPAAGLMGAAAHEGVQAFPNDTVGVIAVGAVALALAGGLVLLARRTEHITSHNILEPPVPDTMLEPPAPVLSAMGAGA
jgi:inorganic phosphate transporter, PiT family